ncbi:hypothetical protein ABZ816_03760 [Actinosynnema sp. NPDC047251]|uniref:Fido domain-containing protein n=1 Tax=Saccharothrix espanaensis (strain ATCC 51144 / DSM 44229 / JCM 9112 / NBRC 15066 / NRRL 15764) TaxID=1179773 RepID=K0JU69_SACES|nr:hypothetical protein [Saccharothrix espanaensis]CCH31375.1 hypothetical protein BN6_40880 [Saccharothrix espanaensis DSM 44229]
MNTAPPADRARVEPLDLVLPTRTHRALAEAEYALGSLNESAQRFTDRSTLVLCTRIRDARSSGALAGEDADLVEALMFHLLVPRAPGDRVALADLLGRHPIGRFVLASAHGTERVAAGGPVDPALLGEISAILTSSEPSGAALPQRTALAAWAAGVRAPGPLSRVARIALAHLHLERLRPFPEANGHVARLFSSLEMVRTGLLRDQILPMSFWLDTHHREYRDRVRAVVRGGPLHEWIGFFADGLRAQALAQLSLVDELDGLRRAHLAVAPKPPSLRRVAGDLVTTPMLTHRTLADRYGVTAKTATQVTRRLVELGVLTSLDDRLYNKVFVCRPVVRLLTTERPVEQSERDGAVFG